MDKIFNKIFLYGKMIKFSHSIFALPFALSAIVLALQTYDFSIVKLFWIIIAMVFARSSAMGFNRIVDYKIDEKNERTKIREIPQKKISILSASIFVFLSSILFILAAFMLGKKPFYASFFILILLFSYSFTKKFTYFCHLYLGFVISLAPLCAWIAYTDFFYPPILFLSLSLMTYIAGFDILYACQDIDFDKKEGLFSIPANLGIKKAMFISSFLHFISILSFVLMPLFFNLKLVYLISISIIAILFIIEHKLVHPNNLSKINIAFFHINSLISIVLFLGILIDSFF